MLRMACRVCVTALLGTLAATPASAAAIATVMDVVNNGYRQPPGDRERRAAPSDELVSDEALRTARDSRIAVKFIDGSELNVESQSEVVLTEYLFDPAAATATGIITLNAGLFHFNSNEVADGGMMLRTPVATIGIRGTEFLVTVADDVTIVDILEGKVEVAPIGGGKPVTCEGGQSVLVAGAQSDAVCGDLGSFATAAAPPAPEEGSRESSRDGADSPEAPSRPGGAGSNPDPGDPGGGDPGDPGGGDPGDPGDPGNPGGGKSNHSGHGDGTNPGKGHGNGKGNGGKNNGGTNNPGGSKS